MRLLAIDIGTSCGWATNYSGKVEVGTWVLATPKEIKEWGRTRLTRRNDPRILRLVKLVAPFCGKIDCMVIEDLEFSSYRKQMQLWSSLRAAIWVACQECEIHYDAVNVKTLKKWATGNGNADKTAMLFAAKTQRPDLSFDEDSADAFHVLTWTIKHVRL